MHRILLVADESSARDIVRIALETWGYDVEEAAESHEGVAVFERVPIDLVIVEVGMPDPNGVETIVRIRELSEAVPIIAVSDSPMALEDATALGVSLTLHKPFDSEKLWVAIRWLLGRRRG
jgi:DNA-binding response OmpR family regulator